MENNICKEHSGCIADIRNLKSGMHELWDYTKGRLDGMDTKIEETKKDIADISKGIQSRINVILGGIVVAVIMMGVNLLVGK